MVDRPLVALFITVCCGLTAHAAAKTVQPTLTPQNSGTTSLLIAVSAVNPQVVWASGAGGTFVVTTVGGKTWRATKAPRGSRYPA